MSKSIVGLAVGCEVGRADGGAEPMHRVCLGQQCGNHQPLIVLGSATLPKLTLLSGGDPE